MKFAGRSRLTLIAIGSLSITLAACSSNPPPPPQATPAPPVASTPIDAGADAPTPTTTASAPPKDTPPTPPLTCPTPSVATALRSCTDIESSVPTMSAIGDVQQKIAMAEMKAPPRKTPKTEADRLAPKPLTKHDQTFFKLTRTYMCRNESGRERGEIAYMEGRHYFELQHWEEAALIFDEIALGPFTDISQYAAQLALEAYNVLSTKLNRPDCNKTLEVKVSQYIKHLCESMTTKGADASTCSTFRKVRDELKASPHRSAP